MNAGNREVAFISQAPSVITGFVHGQKKGFRRMLRPHGHIPLALSQGTILVLGTDSWKGKSAAAQSRLRPVLASAPGSGSHVRRRSAYVGGSQPRAVGPCDRSGEGPESGAGVRMKAAAVPHGG